MWSDTELRNRITRYTFIGKSTKDAAFVIEDAFKKITATKPVRDNIRAAIKQGRLDGKTATAELAAEAASRGICSPREAEDYVAAEQARNLAIQVDEHATLQFTASS
jgi:hypothetical protein